MRFKKGELVSWAFGIAIGSQKTDSIRLDILFWKWSFSFLVER